MQQLTSRQLYAYWDRLRNGRPAPARCEIEPAKIPALLSETFIAESTSDDDYRFRLAGTRICQQFGRELRGTDLLGLWADDDREALAHLLRAVCTDAAVGYGNFRAYARVDRKVNFEFLLLPLTPRSGNVNQVLGAITAIELPFWLGTEPLLRQELVGLKLLRPKAASSFGKRAGADVIYLASRRVRGLENPRSIAANRFPKF
jgi:hypothetical protein